MYNESFEVSDRTSIQAISDYPPALGGTVARKKASLPSSFVSGSMLCGEHLDNSRTLGALRA